jgi:hypothetical protein
MAMPYKEPRRFSIRIRFFVSKYKTSMAKCSTMVVCSQHNQHGLCYHIPYDQTHDMCYFRTRAGGDVS